MIRPKDDFERLMDHYGVDEAEALSMLENYCVDELLPPRGTGLTRIELDDPRDELSNPTLFVIGLAVATAFILGAGWLTPKILK